MGLLDLADNLVNCCRPPFTNAAPSIFRDKVELGQRYLMKGDNLRISPILAFQAKALETNDPTSRVVKCLAHACPFYDLSQATGSRKVLAAVKKLCNSHGVFTKKASPSRSG